MNRPTRSNIWRSTVWERPVWNNAAGRGAAERRGPRRRRGVLGFLGFLLLALPSLVAAQEPKELPTTVTTYPGAAPAAGDMAEELGIEVVDGKAELSLEQAVALALDRNLTLVVQRYARSQSIHAIRQNKGIYDIDLSATGGTQTDTSPTTSALQATGGQALSTESQQLNMTLTQLTPLGGTAEVDFTNTRFTSTDRNNTLNPRFIVGLDFTFTQPLLRNLGRDVTERNLIVARTNAAISREDFQVQVEAIIQQSSDAYWALVESLEQLQVAEESLRLAEELHEMNKIQVEVGTKAPLEVITSEARVAARRQDIIRFRAQVADNADVLRRLANLDRGRLWDVEIVPTTNPEEEHEKIDVEAAVETALDSRPDVHRRRLQNDTLELDAKVARNLKRPRLDVSATYGANAVEGDAFTLVLDPNTGQPIPVPIGSTDYLDALDTISKFTFDGWTLGFNFAYPFRNRNARARSVIADLASEQGEYQLKDLELQILTEVRTAARAVETAAEQIESAKVSSRLQEKNLDAEQKRYENGLSTSFQVLEIQEDLSQAKSAEVSAIISYRRAQTAFYRAIGKLLDQYDVTLADDSD